MRTVDGVINIDNSVADTDEELNIIIDRDKAAYYNISANNVYQTVSLALNSSTISKYRGGEEELDIVLKYPDEMTTSLDDLRNLMIPSNTGGQVPLSEVASIEHGFGQKSITRQDQSRVETVSCDVYGRDLSSVNTEIMALVDQLPVPAGCTINSGGDIESMMEVFNDLYLAIMMALILVYMVMACQFESLWNPLLIMASVPVMFIGVFVGLFLTGQRISMMSLLGISVKSTLARCSAAVPELLFEASIFLVRRIVSSRISSSARSFFVRILSGSCSSFPGRVISSSSFLSFATRSEVWVNSCSRIFRTSASA